MTSLELQVFIGVVLLCVNAAGFAIQLPMTVKAVTDLDTKRGSCKLKIWGGLQIENAYLVGALIGILMFGFGISEHAKNYSDSCITYCVTMITGWVMYYVGKKADNDE